MNILQRAFCGPVSNSPGYHRSTKVAHKLKVLPEQDDLPTQSSIVNEDKDGSGNDDLDVEEEEGDAQVSSLLILAHFHVNPTGALQVYKQIAQIPAGTARRDALRLTKAQKAKLPRVTAYCTAT